MSSATVTSNGRVTIPADVRSTMGLVAGDKVEFVKLENGQFAISRKTYSLREMAGMIPKPDRPVSIEEMNDSIADAASVK